MPILSIFPGGSGSGGGGLALAAVTSITTQVAHGRVYVKWTDPDDLVVAGSTLASWGGTLLVRKAGSMPTSRRDGTVVLDSKTKNQYQNNYFCDSGLTDGTVYYYKFFPYTTTNTYTDSTDDEFSATPVAIAPGNVSGKSVAASGNGKLTVKWTDPDATIVTDGLTVSTWASTKVVYKTGSYPTSPEDGTLAVNSTTRNAYSTNGFQITGLTNGTTYYTSIFPVSTEGAVNTNSANRISGVANRMTIDTVPSQSGTLTYSGSAQSPSWSNYDSTKMTLSVTAQTNAGTYSASFTPKDDYMWSDGSTTAKSVNWTIGKASGSLTLSKTSIALDTTTESDTFTVTRSGDGAISVSSSDTSKATVSLSGTTVTVTGVATGNVTITVSVAEGTNYTAPANKTCDVTVTFVQATLNNNSWATISSVSAKSEGANYWSVGDCKSIAVKGTVGTLSVDGTYWVYILGFNHNSSVEGTGIQFGTFKTAQTDGVDVCFVDSKYNSTSYDGTKYFNLNHWGSSSSPYNTNYGGWAACDARYDILGSTDQQPSVYGNTKTTSAVGYDASTTTATNPVANTLMAALPSDLRAVMKPITKYTDAVGNSSNTQANVKASVDYLPLLAEFEIFGARSYANTYEQNYQQQYTYFHDGNSKVKYRHSSTSSTAYWWERSPSYHGAGTFCIVNTNGNATTDHSRSSNGLAPAFMV